jgi:HPt (histidine-containing phosphotransfer) domain-containing protein
VGDRDAVNLTQLEAAVGDPAFVRRLISTFLGDAPGLVATLRSSLEHRNFEELRRAAHTLKSNGTTFGATALASLSEELELKAQAGTLAGADELLTRIETEYARVEGALGALAGEA